MAEKRRTSSATIVKLVSVAVLALFLVVVGISQRQAIYNQLYDWKLIPRPERLTELYFTNHTELPKTYTIGEKQTVAFTVHNLEYRDTTYMYTITVANEDEVNTRTIQGDPFTLVHDESKNIVQALVPVDMGQRAKVTVTLTYDGIAFGEDEPSKQTQSIHYWVEKKG